MAKAASRRKKLNEKPSKKIGGENRGIAALAQRKYVCEK